MIPAVMLWMGPAAALTFVYYMALVGGACALVILLVRRTMPAEVIPGFMRKPFEDKANVPYGVAIAAGALFAGAGSPCLPDCLTPQAFPVNDPLGGACNFPNSMNWLAA